MQVPTTAVAGKTRFQYKWIVALVVTFGAFMSILDQTIVNIAIPHLQRAFGANLNGVQWVLTAYILTQGVITPTTAYFADRFGTKRFYSLALAIFTIGSALCGLAWNLPILIIFRIVQGVGGACLFPLAITMLYREFPPQQRGLASGLLGIAALLAPAVGPTLGGYFVTYVSWQWIFFINVPIGVIGITLAILLLHEVRTGMSPRFDVPGFLMAATGLAAVLYGLSDASADGWGSAKVLASLLGGLLILSGFVIFELHLARHEKQPLLNLRLFANGPFLSSNIANVLITFAFFGGLFLFPIYLQSLRGLDAFHSGLLLLPQAGASIVAALIGGRLVDRFGVRVILIPGLVLLALASWQLAYITLDTPYGWIQVLFVMRGIALGFIIQPLSVSALSDIHPRNFAQASSLFTVVRFISTSLGIAVLATFVQSQAKVHFTNLAGQSARAALPGQLARLAAHLQQQSYLLAIQDAFWLTLVVLIAAIVSAFFIRMHKSMPSATPATAQNTHGELDGIETIV